ncbi:MULTISPECIES: GNAT family N-acetyltransferase [Thermomonospora]|uniref:GCN5-related N-acetyltransferase n=1 Tax=Thermomonospora curvata (strain ATCC 19995 / DSM 43183 / JCM 3096 / KCTC 9072 / NBRC 15933 / NCIMB 10081 / Henssen B9) TaxID=471852 RepID=D1ABQ3_THECD|nr:MULTISPECIES: GNAT family N-acetyltransferase [Thermomonospora]ACY99076.1 GCN5-related N-acetyltransferase [Thermomonospora curvata DSM 43183]PKK13260.1 MAG: N-acetyltransferase [Thermomonospora sp. CIF 1]
MSTRVSDNPAASRYEIHIAGRLAGFVRYQPRGGAVALIHTEVAEEYEGQGVGSALARGVLDELRSKGVRVVPLCPFIKGYIRRHPEYRDLVATD